MSVHGYNFHPIAELGFWWPPNYVFKNLQAILDPPMRESDSGTRTGGTGNFRTPQNGRDRKSRQEKERRVSDGDRNGHRNDRALRRDEADPELHRELFEHVGVRRRPPRVSALRQFAENKVGRFELCCKCTFK